MLQLARRIALRVNVGDLLQLERTFHRDRKERTTAEEERVMFIRKALRKLLDDSIEREGLVDQRRQLN